MTEQTNVRLREPDKAARERPENAVGGKGLNTKNSLSIQVTGAQLGGLKKFTKVSSCSSMAKL
jgi:hypothetical protein